MQVNVDCEKCNEKIKILRNMYQIDVSSHATYTSLILTGCYATMITFFSMMHKYMSIRNKMLIIIFLVVSISSFLVNEVWKMRIGVDYTSRVAKLWNKYYSYKINLVQYDRRRIRFNNLFYKNYTKLYPILFNISLYFGIIAVFLIFISAIKYFFIFS